MNGAQCCGCGVALNLPALPSGRTMCVYCAGLVPRPLGSAELLDAACRDAIEVGREQFARKSQEGCHVCGKPPANGVLTICQPDREGSDALACCDSCARNREPIGAVRGSVTLRFDPAGVVPTPDGHGKPDAPARRLGNSVAASLAENRAVRFGMRRASCDRIEAVDVDERPSWVVQAALPKLADQFADAIKAESVPPNVGGQLSTVEEVDRHFLALRKDMERLLPDGRGKAVALTQLDTARLWALSVAGEVKP